MKGNCYEQTLELLVQNMGKQNVRVVHGYPRLLAGKHKGKKFGHAWLEFEETLELSFPITLRYCLDRLKPEEPLLQALYYHVGRIDASECTRYTAREALALIRTTGHSGPWHDKVKDALFA